MTSTSVVLGIARLGTPEATPDCDCAMDAGRHCHHVFHRVTFSIQFGFVPLLIRVRSYSLGCKKNHSSAKLFMKNFLASINLCSRI